jgi:hypothetical protein
MPPDKKGPCPGGGDHKWVKIAPGTYKCASCPAVKKTGEGSTGIEKKARDKN